MPNQNAHLCLLAPVPAEHISSALDVANSGSPVAFGTGSFEFDDGPAAMWEFFSELKKDGLWGQLPVYIQVSASGQLGNPSFIGPKVSFAGVLLDWAEAKSTGKHITPAERPASALTIDRRWSGFWRVRDFRKLAEEKRVQLGDFRTAKSGKPNAVVTKLRGPIRAFAPNSIKHQGG